MTGKREDIPAGLLAGYGKIAGERVKGDVRVRPATVVVVTFALGACLGTNEGPATSPEPSEEVETQTLTGTSLTQAVVPASSATTLSPEPTTIPTLNPALPTPDFTQSEIADQYLLAPSGSGCQLPCWQGLRIGVSTREDVLGVLNSLFDFGGYVDFFDDNSVTKLDSVSRSLLDVPGVEGSGYSWVTTETLFSLLAVVDAETGVLQGLQFRHVTGLYTERLPHRYTIRTPREIIEQLGSPAAIYTTGQGSWLMAVLLFYEQGIVSYSLLEVQDGQHLESGQITSTQSI